MSGTIQLVTVGNVPRTMLKELAQPITATFKITCVSGAPLTQPQYALNPSRKQFHATAILRRLAAQLAPEQLGVVGICDVDLFTPEAEFVFGEADRESRVALVSLARLKEGVLPELVLRRAQTELVHEVGHLVGLSHCEDLHCAMFLSRTPLDTDHKGLALCNDCRHELARLIKIEPPAR